MERCEVGGGGGGRVLRSRSEHLNRSSYHHIFSPFCSHIESLQKNGTALREKTDFMICNQGKTHQTGLTRTLNMDTSRIFLLLYWQ